MGVFWIGLEDSADDKEMTIRSILLFLLTDSTPGVGIAISLRLRNRTSGQIDILNCIFTCFYSTRSFGL